MSLLSLNKTGLAAMMVLQLLYFSMCPACARPSSEDEDEDTVTEVDEEENEDLLDKQDGLHQDEDEMDEEDVTSSDNFLDLCAKKPGLKLEDCLKELIKEKGGSLQDCELFKGNTKSYIDCLSKILENGKKGSKSGSGEQINWK